MNESTESKVENTVANVKDEEVKLIIEKFYGLKDGDIKRLLGYDDLNFQYSSPKNNNPYISKIWPHGYVLKIMNSFDSKNVELTEFQNKILLFLKEHNICAPVPVKNLMEKYYIKIKIPLKYKSETCQKEHIVRLLKFQPGILFLNIPKSFDIFYLIGKFTAKLDKVLKNFTLRSNLTFESKWYLQNAPILLKYINLVNNLSHRKIVQNVIEEFISKVLSQQNTFEKGVIHGDINPHNILMSQNEEGKWDVAAILDLGDSHFSNYFFELAITITYMMLECKRHNLDIIVGAGHVLAGFLNIWPDFNINYNTRICQSLVLGLHTFSLHPENTYVLDSQDVGWSVLETLWQTQEEYLAEIWGSVIDSYST
ncbi:conserved hypothetical protein [Pediculus humanus corporis]|uniref:Hydroxylysine kinase n=1 Tax=Pediculus humanus subsp. corporis TaxID=121224 RepID=E0VQ59_PEDHC|nr:uncharacterized protein Phum_PHUM372110 [Pediculus humanus corporis]EEB15515.1 conserved hypothetical protein [Pediculus humanus corporis]